MTIARMLSISASILAAPFLAASCAGAITADMPTEPAPLDASSDANSMSDSGDVMDASTDALKPYDGPIGKACTSDADCGDPYRCQLTAPGGYCLMNCTMDIACPEGTLCSPLPNSRVTGVCMRACSTKADCRPEYDCEIVSLFSGDPSAPMSPGPVCWEPQSKDGGP